MKYISINLYRKMINHALHEGMKPEEMSHLSIPINPSPEIKAVPADTFFALHEWLDEKLGPGFSVRIGQEMKMEDYGVLGLSWKTISRTGEMFERSERYFKLLSNTYVFKVKRENELSYIHLYRPPYRRGVGLSNEATFSATVVVLRAITETDISPLTVAFMHDPPRDMEDYHKAFNCPILFNQPENYITYKSTDLDMRTAKADLSINKFLVDRVEEETKGIEVSAIKIAVDVEHLIEDALPSGIPNIDQIGEHIGMSSRTLKRRLAQNGLTFRDLIRQTQERLSKNLLRNTSRTISEIAFQTGFSEQSAFSRAFKRWTGQSPLDFRNPQ
ncbi:MAG: AraC family transcriptional regulator ligand-binding domain-containing protein [Bacteroidota bacterium]